MSGERGQLHTFLICTVRVYHKCLILKILSKKEQFLLCKKVTELVFKTQFSILSYSSSKYQAVLH
jgi:hypothetical protein